MNDESLPAAGGADPSQPNGDAQGTSAKVAEKRSPSERPGSLQLDEGSRIGGYLLGECIGQGGMARVYRAEHEGLQRHVALKVLLDAPAGLTDGHERFLREARIAAAIKHPNVVNIFDVGVERGTPYLVMELLEGADLDAFMGGKNRLDEATVMDIIVPIAGALAAVHDAGIVHRDLKPGNIFLARGHNDELEPRLLDFGISKSLGERLKLTSAHGPVLGTPFYMAPEAASGGEMTPQSDQYALGVVLYECLTGTNPFAQATNFAEVVHRVSTGTYTPASVQNPQLSRRMAAIIERAMQLDPARRFPDMRAMGRELLMLAGQRTRVTWGLSFNNPALGALATVSAHDDDFESPPATVRQRPRRRALWAIPAVLGAVLAAGPWLVSTLQSATGPRAEPVAAAAARPTTGAPPLTLALRPERGEAVGVNAPTGAPTSETTTAENTAAEAQALDGASAEADLSETATGSSLALAAAGSGSIALPGATTDGITRPGELAIAQSRGGSNGSSAGSSGTASAVVRALRGSGTRTRSQGATRAAKTTVFIADAPEWASRSAASSSDSNKERYGTNGAPIFD